MHLQISRVGQDHVYTVRGICKVTLAEKSKHPEHAHGSGLISTYAYRRVSQSGFQRRLVNY